MKGFNCGSSFASLNGLSFSNRQHEKQQFFIHHHQHHLVGFKLLPTSLDPPKPFSHEYQMDRRNEFHVSAVSLGFTIHSQLFLGIPRATLRLPLR